MALGDKIGAKADDLAGKGKEAAGNVTGNDDLRTEGQADQAKAGLKEAVEDVKDAVGNAAAKLRNVVGKD
ncbi:CsbD family protein [Amycolatopsis sp. FBCC-B4732]|uniref:CsbD family protein n=1 Tax=Amycolatopsis sp. FBCC-B4732 TaxID=3079339 RepID=UPI001FF1CEFB|nr:CsbD family protein [Amycolatopsis sp. FBCC-B4732]UOX90566.1 CsbD family protein [Amycolatopsis sp. FBCC-B4732]